MEVFRDCAYLPVGYLPEQDNALPRGCADDRSREYGRERKEHPDRSGADLTPGEEFPPGRVDLRSRPEPCQAFCFSAVGKDELLQFVAQLSFGIQVILPGQIDLDLQLTIGELGDESGFLIQVMHLIGP
jgi:hypothetical protein